MLVAELREIKVAFFITIPRAAVLMAPLEGN